MAAEVEKTPVNYHYLVMSNLSFTKRATLLFFSIVAIAISVSTVIFMLGYVMFSQLVQIGKATLKPTSINCNCDTVLSFLDDPIRFIGMLTISIAIVVFIIYLLWQTIVLFKGTNQFIKHYNIVQRKDDFNVVNHTIPFAFCGGLLRPSVYISTGLLQTLSEDEVAAVVKHEIMHKNRKEPLRLFVILLLMRMFGFIPVVRKLGEQYIVYAELIADSYATHGFTDKRFLASALYKLLALKQDATYAPIALSLFESVTAVRIDVLTDENSSSGITFLSRKLLIGACIVFFMTILISTFLFTHRKALAEYNPITCRLPQVEVMHRCKMQS